MTADVYKLILSEFPFHHKHKVLSIDVYYRDDDCNLCQI